MVDLPVEAEVALEEAVVEDHLEEADAVDLVDAEEEEMEVVAVDVEEDAEDVEADAAGDAAGDAEADAVEE